MGRAANIGNIGLAIFHLAGDVDRLPPSIGFVDAQGFVLAGKRDLASVVMPPVLVDNAADSRRIKPARDPVQDNLCNRCLTFPGFAACFEIDGFGNAAIFPRRFVLIDERGVIWPRSRRGNLAHAGRPRHPGKRHDFDQCRICGGGRRRSERDRADRGRRSLHQPRVDRGWPHCQCGPVLAGRRLGDGMRRYRTVGSRPWLEGGDAVGAGCFVVRNREGARWPGFVKMENQVVGAETREVLRIAKSRVECRP